MHTVILIDSDPMVRTAAVHTLVNRFPGLAVYAAANGVDGLRLIQRHNPDAVIFDLVLSGMDGLELLMHLQSHYPTIDLIVTAANRWVLHDLQRRFGESGKLFTLAKPYTPEALVNVAADFLQTRPDSVLRDLALTSVLQLFHLEGKTCRLEVEGTAVGGIVQMWRGQVVFAECGEQRGLEALQEMISIPRPICRVYAGDDRFAGPRNIHAQFTELILLCCTASDERCRVA